MCLIVGLVDDGLDMQVGAHTFGIGSSGAVNAVNELYRAVGLPQRPDIVDIAVARNGIVAQGLSTDWLAGQMQRLIRKRVDAEPEIR